MALDLPEPDDAAILHSRRLVQIIFERIGRRGGVIGFDEYMNSVLYEPGLGYYSAGATRFGPAGDFTTAPEISSLFGTCLGAQCEALLEQGCEARVLEFGAGSGKLCAQLLQSSTAINHYLILEVSAALKASQREYLERHLPADLFHKIEWLDALPVAFNGIVLANEVMDAMPVHVLVKQDDWRELGVACDGNGFDWQICARNSEATAEMARIESSCGELPQGYRSEVNMNFRPWLAALAKACDRVVVLIIDYGYEQSQYYHPLRREGTLICHYRHRVHADPFVYPGLQDVTAFVDFDSLADAAEAAGFDLAGLVSQAGFLIANGLLEAARLEAESASAETRLTISQQVKSLTLAEEMGEKFKVLGLTKNLELEMPALRRGTARG